MRKLLEPVAGGFFMGGAKRDAHHWGKRYGLADDSPEVQKKQAALYEHEISHLPQAVMWNAFSIPLNYAAQWTRSKMRGEKMSLGKFVIGKTFGSLFSNTVLIGGRGMAPELFNQWDRANSRHVIKPILKTIGLDEKSIDEAQAREARERGDDWQSRIEREHADGHERSQVTQK